MRLHRIKPKDVLRKALVRAAVRSGFVRNKRRLKVLMYHRFMSDGDAGYATRQSVFREQIAFLKSRFTVVALDDFLRKSPEERARIPSPLAITVDDGYRNFFDFAYPVLKENHIGATLFLPYEFIENGGWMWQDRNKHILRNTRIRRTVFRWHGLSIPLALDTFEGLMEGLDAVYNACLPLAMPDRAVFSEKLALSLDVPLPLKPTGEFMPLNWDQIKEMEQNKIVVASHTMHHEILPFLTPDRAAYEINESKKMIEKRTGHRIEGFCFPNGDYNDQLAATVKEGGYSYAVTTRWGSNDHHSSPFELHRISCDSNNLLDFFSAVIL